MDKIDRIILTAAQRNLPVSDRPLDDLAARLRLEPADVLARIVRLVERRVIRRIGPVFDSSRLGYVSTLVAARVPPARLRAVAEQVNLLRGVTHNYERRHAYNLWFTLTSPSRAAEAETLEQLRRETGVRDIFSLPALAVYKICVQFNLCEEGGPASDRPRVAHRPAVGADAPPVAPCALPAGAEALPAPGSAAPVFAGGAVVLTEEQKELVRLTQDGLPPVREPLAEVAARLGWPDGRIVEQLREWLAQGVVRRFGAVVQHRELGLKANGMAVFCAPEGRADEAGRRLARWKHVTHCYRRPPLADFHYNLYAMVHGRSEDEVCAAVGKMAADAGLAAHEVLFSVAEFKKTSMRYFV